MIKERIVEARKMIGKKIVKDKEYSYEYYILPLELYIPKEIIQRFGTKFYLQFNEETGKITIEPLGVKNDSTRKVD